MTTKPPTIYEFNVRLYAPTASVKKWRIVYYIHPGSKRTEDRRAETFLVKADAVRRCQELVAAFREGTDTRTDEKLLQPFSALAEAWVTRSPQESQWSQATYRVYEQQLRVWILPHLENVQCRQLTKQHIAAIFQSMNKAHRSASYMKLTGSVCVALIRWGQEQGYIPRNADLVSDVFITAKKLRQASEASEYIAPEEIPSWEDVMALAEEFRNLRDWTWGLAVRFAARTGLRRGELLALRIEDINLDLANPTVKVLRQVHPRNSSLTMPPKQNKVRETFWTPDLHSDLVRLVARAEQLKKDGKNPLGLLWPASKGKRLHYGRSLFDDDFRDAAERAGWPYEDKTLIDQDGNPVFKNGVQETRRMFKWTWHSLRHHAATWWLATAPEGLGLEVADVSAFLGHHDTSFTWRVYVSQRKGAIGRAAQAAQRAHTAVQGLPEQRTETGRHLQVV